MFLQNDGLLPKYMALQARKPSQEPEIQHVVILFYSSESDYYCHSLVQSFHRLFSWLGNFINLWTEHIPSLCWQKLAIAPNTETLHKYVNLRSILILSSYVCLGLTNGSIRMNCTWYAAHLAKLICSFSCPGCATHRKRIPRYPLNRRPSWRKVFHPVRKWTPSL
jgi:hypothetical protein